jgi:hypothetical protein
MILTLIDAQHNGCVPQSNLSTQAGKGTITVSFRTGGLFSYGCGEVKMYPQVM